MASWNRPVSWSKFKLALDCPAQLELVIDGTGISDYRPDYYANLGKTVQYVFELYFTKGLNLTPRGQREEVVLKIADKVLNSSWFTELNTIYPYGKNEKDMREAVMKHVANGFVQFVKLGIIGRSIQSEVPWRATFHNFRIFGMMDFILETSKGVYVFDGKGHAAKNADERQILYYALVLHASGKNVLGAGFLYWQHDYTPIDVSSKALKDFIDGDFARGREVFMKMNRGEKLVATPSTSKCHYCSWKSECGSSLYKKTTVNVGMGDTVSFGAQEPPKITTPEVLGGMDKGIGQEIEL